MLKYCVIIIFFYCTFTSQSQSQSKIQDSVKTTRDSIKKVDFLKQLGNGYFPTKYINIDLRYLIKFNQYEGFRTGLGGTTNEDFSKKYRINGYLVYGFRDHNYKYSIGGGFRIAPETNTWVNLSYTDDLQETGSSAFLSDRRFFSFFEPRLLNIDLFHWHVTKAMNIEHQFSNTFLSELQLAVSDINPTYDYVFATNNTTYKEFRLTTAKIAFQWSPFSEFENTKNGIFEKKVGYPKFTLQYTKNFKNVLKSNVDFSKLDFRSIFQTKHKNSAISELIITGGLTNGNTPITHMYHAYPNNIRKETIMQRFSVAGIKSFETMYFNEFFSDRFTTVQFKHFFNRFNITNRFKPQLVLITKYAIGNMDNIERHQNISFNTLNKGYNESGFEINNLVLGFGLSFAYRYGAYHLPKLEDNVAFKFTFNVSF
ncbi:hypothetical protein A9Q87_03445 [Flavobacteriales bacterium 34_180_T64]|nr:hypothetical protein A9Q87_03445 [Flavobacteriales bacterium 34_180_T64]